MQAYPKYIKGWYYFKLQPLLFAMLDPCDCPGLVKTVHLARRERPLAIKFSVRGHSQINKNSPLEAVPPLLSPVRRLSPAWSPPLFSCFVPSARSPHALPPPNLRSSPFSFCSIMAPSLSANDCASCCARVASTRWNTTTPDD